MIEPAIAPGLPGIVTCRSARSSVVHSSRWTMLISSPTNFFAKPGMPSAGCTWSTTTVIPAPAPSSVISDGMPPWAMQTSSRKAGSASIAKTWSGGASYVSSCRNFMAAIMPTVKPGYRLVHE